MRRGGHIGRNIGERTMKIKTTVRKPLMIKTINNFDKINLHHLRVLKKKEKADIPTTSFISGMHYPRISLKIYVKFEISHETRASEIMKAVGSSKSTGKSIIYHNHHIALVARIALTLSRHSSLSFIALGRSSGQHPVSSHSC